MTLAQNMQDDVVDVLLDTTEHAEMISYTVTGGSPKNISAIVFREEDLRLTIFDDGQQQIRRISMLISTDSTAGIATVDKDDTATIDSEVWNVTGSSDRDGS